VQGNLMGFTSHLSIQGADAREPITQVSIFFIMYKKKLKKFEKLGKQKKGKKKRKKKEKKIVQKNFFFQIALTFLLFFPSRQGSIFYLAPFCAGSFRSKSKPCRLQKPPCIES